MAVRCCCPRQCKCMDLQGSPADQREARHCLPGMLTWRGAENVRFGTGPERRRLKDMSWWESFFCDSKDDYVNEKLGMDALRKGRKAPWSWRGAFWEKRSGVLGTIKTKVLLKAGACGTKENTRCNGENASRKSFSTYGITISSSVPYLQIVVVAPTDKGAYKRNWVKALRQQDSDSLVKETEKIIMMSKSVHFISLHDKNSTDERKRIGFY